MARSGGVGGEDGAFGGVVLSLIEEVGEIAGRLHELVGDLGARHGLAEHLRGDQHGLDHLLEEGTGHEAVGKRVSACRTEHRAGNGEVIGELRRDHARTAATACQDERELERFALRDLRERVGLVPGQVASDEPGLCWARSGSGPAAGAAYGGEGCGEKLGDGIGLVHGAPPSSVG